MIDPSRPFNINPSFDPQSESNLRLEAFASIGKIRVVDASGGRVKDAEVVVYGLDEDTGTVVSSSLKVTNEEGVALFGTKDIRPDATRLRITAAKGTLQVEKTMTIQPGQVIEEEFQLQGELSATMIYGAWPTLQSLEAEGGFVPFKARSCGFTTDNVPTATMEVHRWGLIVSSNGLLDPDDEITVNFNGNVTTYKVLDKYISHNTFHSTVFWAGPSDTFEEANLLQGTREEGRSCECLVPPGTSGTVSWSVEGTPSLFGASSNHSGSLNVVFDDAGLCD